MTFIRKRLFKTRKSLIKNTSEEETISNNEIDDEFVHSETKND
jgi:hypothetical protein